MAKPAALSTPTSNQRLISLIERIERLLEEKKALSSDIADIKQEAKSAGFDVKVMNQMIRERAMDEAAREEHLALAEIYRAALGMLNGTPLGESARKRFDPPAPPPPPVASAPRREKPDAKDESEVTAPEPEAPKGPTETDIAQARVEGGEAALSGAPVTKNPWPASDVRRASWDEGWCAQAGSDGMEIPAAWRRRPKKAEQPGGAA